MKLKFFTIPVAASESAEVELNRFLATHRIAGVERQLIVDGAASLWAICVTWIDGEVPAAPADTAKRGRIDYREILAADEFALYDRLRSLRKQQAEAEGLPPFAVFTNEQLADMIRQRVTTPAGLAAIEGIGEARLSRYGTPFLALLREGVPRLAAAGPTAAGAGPGPGAGDKAG